MKRFLAELGWWQALASKGPLRILALNAVSDAWGSGMAMVCLPFLVVKTTGHSAGQLALVLSVAGVCELLGAVPNGTAAARVGLKRFIQGTKTAQALAYTVVALSGNLYVLLAAMALDGFSRAGASGLNQTLTAAVLGEAKRSEALGAIRALRNAGYLLSGACAGLLLSTGSGSWVRAGLAGNAVSFLLGALWLAVLHPRTTAAPVRRTDWSVLRDGTYVGLVVCAAVFSSSLLVLTTALPLWVLREGIPGWTVGTAVVVNTLLVVCLQYRRAQKVSTVDSALRGVRVSTVYFALMAGLIIATAGAPTALACVALLAAAVALTFAEMSESPSWWTLSYELAPADRKSQYMAAFDLSWAIAGIAGPLAMVAVVSLGRTGWLCFAALIAAAAAAAGRLVRRRMPVTPPATLIEACDT